MNRTNTTHRGVAGVGICVRELRFVRVQIVDHLGVVVQIFA